MIQLSPAFDFAARPTVNNTPIVINGDLVYNVKAYGAVGNGVADDTSAINAAITAAGAGVVFFPLGTYLTTSALNIATGSRFSGASKKGAILKNNTGNVFSFAANANWFEVDHLTVQASAGHIFAGSHNLSAFSVHDCSFQQNANGFSIWNQTGGSCIEGYFVLNDLYMGGSAPTVPGWALTDTAASHNANVWEKCVCTTANASSAYFFSLVSQGSGNNSYDNVFRDMVWEQCVGGAIFAQSQFGMLIENPQIWDGNVIGNSTADYIHIGKYSTGLNSRSIRITNYSRQSSTLGSGLYDISFDSSSQQVLLDSVRAAPDNANINLGGSSLIWVANQSPGTILTNATNAPSTFTGSGNPNSVAVWQARVGDVFFDQASTNGVGIWKCSVAGTPGTWVPMPLPYVQKDSLVYNVQDHGLLADNSTDNSAALDALIALVPEGSEIYFPGNGSTPYLFSAQILINKSIKLRGNWNRATSGSAVTGSVLRPTNNAAQLAMTSLIKVNSGRVVIEGLALVGKATAETNGTITVGSTTVQLSSATAASNMVGAQIAGPGIIAGTSISSVNTGSNQLTLSSAAVGYAITGITSTSSAFTITFRGPHSLSVGSTLTLSGFTPSGYNGTWTVASVTAQNVVTVTSALNPGTSTVNGTYATTFTGASLYLGGHGLLFGGATGNTTHNSIAQHVYTTQFNQGVVLGSQADHVTLEDCESGGNYDGVLFDAGNLFDFSFINCNLVGNIRASARLAANTGVESVSFIRTHLGFSQYGILQDVTTTGDGYVGVDFINSPIEYVSVQHILMTNGGNISVHASCYWTWTNGSPANPAFTIAWQQNGGNIWFFARLDGTNANCPSVFLIGTQVNSAAVFFQTQLPSGWASAAYPFTSYNSMLVPGSAFFNGGFLQTSSTTTTNINGTFSLQTSARWFINWASKALPYATSTANDKWVRLTSGTGTFTLTTSTNAQVILVTNETSATASVVATSGSVLGAQTLPPNAGAFYLCDGTNWRTISSWGCDVFVSDDAARGLVLKDSAGTPHYWRLTVGTDGALTTTDLGTTRPTS